MSTDFFATEDDQQLVQNGSRTRHRTKDTAARLEAEILIFQQDETKMAREIILLRKELSRLHYKVKNYQGKNSTMAMITNILILGMLAAIIYKLYFLG